MANETTDKGLIFKIYKQLIQLNATKTQSKRPKQTFLQRRHTDCQEAHEMMFNITSYEKTTNQNYNEISPHTKQSNHHQKIKQ